MNLSNMKAEFMREELPYGVRTFSNGTIELFNRKYETLARRGPEPEGHPTSEVWYYTDANPPWEDRQTKLRCEQILRGW